MIQQGPSFFRNINHTIKVLGDYIIWALWLLFVVENAQFGAKKWLSGKL
jgi:hypothetical protein